MPEDPVIMDTTHLLLCCQAELDNPKLVAAVRPVQPLLFPLD